MKLSLSVLDREIEKLYLLHLREKPESLRQFLWDSPTLYHDVFQYYDVTKIIIKERTRQGLQRLAILSWYFPEEIRIIFQLSLEEHWFEIDRYNVEKEILLSSKPVALAWVLKESGWSEWTFFGNILNMKACQKALSRLAFVKVSRRRVRKYTGYSRGYPESNRGAPRSFPPEWEVWVLDPEVLERKELKFQLKVQSCLERINQFLEVGT